MAADSTLEAPQQEVTQLSEESLQASSGYVGQWQTLVSTTNWEKGRIICDWRAALEKSGAPVTDYSDEAWAQMVGDVTGQHVGRLRRTFERFGEVAREYEGLYWSHFQVALDWQDAEMWLEGAIQNGWSVAVMRAKRWETVEGSEDQPKADSQEAPAPAAAAASTEEAEEPARAVDAEVRDVEPGESEEYGESDGDAGEDALATAPSAERRQNVQPMKDLAELPEDLAEAFEQFKLAILTHKMTGWEEVSRDDVLASLAALEQLALAPSGD